MKIYHYILPLFILIFLSVGAQESVLSISEPYGPYAIGFREFNTLDKSRSFSVESDASKDKGKTISRPIQVCVWYPAVATGQTPIKYEDYFFLKAHEVGRTVLTKEGRERLIAEFIETDPVNRDVLDRELNAPMKAVKNAPFEEKKRFPVLIYGPSWWSTAFENALLFEFLASHGYVVVSSPSVGPETREMPISRISVETQARDMEYLLSILDKFPNADPHKISLGGFSLGGLSNVLMMARNRSVDAWIGLDPSIHEAYDFFKDSPYEDYRRFTKPMLFINSLGYMNELPFYDKLVYSDAYMVNLPQLDHTDLASKFIKLFGSGDAADKIRGYNLIAKYSLAFLDGVYKYSFDYGSMMAQVFEQPSDTSFVKIKSKKGIPTVAKLFERYKNHKGEGLTAFLNDRLTSDKVVNYPEADLQDLIFRCTKSGFTETSVRLMQWYQTSYTNTFHSKVLEHIPFDRMLQMFQMVYANNGGCHFDYEQLNHTGHLLSMGEKGREALDYFVLNIQLNPKSYKAFFNLGIGYYRLEDFDRAAIHFKKCLELNPDERYRDLAQGFLAKI
ncbi:tetratricopeptide repeat protein [Flavobacteriaceae bacterium 3-367]